MQEPHQLLDSQSLVIVFIGASAVGKSTIAQHLCQAGAVDATPTWTTRKPRPGEWDTDYDHHFVSEGTFEQYSRAGGFVDEHSIYGARYGVPALRRPSEGREALVVLKPIFIPKFIARYPNARIYPIEASREVLPERMRGRGQSEADIAKRMQQHEREAADARHFAHVLPFNNDGSVEQIVQEVKDQIRRDRAAYDIDPGASLRVRLKQP